MNTASPGAACPGRIDTAERMGRWEVTTKRSSMMKCYALALAIVAVSAQAETTIYGLTIGKPLPLSECPKSQLYRGGPIDYRSAEVPCAKEFRPKATPMDIGETWVIEYPFSQRPAHAQNNLVAPIMVNGILEGVHIWTNGRLDQEAVFRDLVAKFGEPTKKTLTPKSNLFGASLQSIDANWDQGDDLQVIFVGIDEKADQGVLFIASKRGMQAHVEKRKRGSGSRTPL